MLGETAPIDAAPLDPPTGGAVAVPGLD